MTPWHTPIQHLTKLGDGVIHDMGAGGPWYHLHFFLDRPWLIECFALGELGWGWERKCRELAIPDHMHTHVYKRAAT